MGLFNFLAENGRGCMAALAKDKLLYEVNIFFGDYVLVLDSYSSCQCV